MLMTYKLLFNFSTIEIVLALTKQYKRLNSHSFFFYENYNSKILHLAEEVWHEQKPFW